ncbi:MAG: CHAD domain-containing protein [Phycisphaerales bacterium]|nr:MAG: CHAD domain-containing protein [Phycisphaerales bacterium]
MATIDPSYQLLACQYLRKQLDALIKEVRGVRENQDIEPVHQARVASRRLRAALGMFDDCFESKKVDKWRKRIRKVTKGLGAARDLDVQIQFLEQFLAHLDAAGKRHRPGVERLVLRLRQNRAAVQPKVVKALDALEKGNAMAQMHGELEKAHFLLRHRAVSVQSPYAFERTAAHIRDRVQTLLAHEQTLADPSDAPGHHQLRIDAKRLRYTMEICDPVYDGQLGPVIKAVKKAQTLLGDIHDCDVWAQDVESFTDEERLRTIAYFGHDGPFSPLKPGLQLLLDERRRCRAEIFDRAVEHWTALNEDHLWETLDAVLRSPVAVAAQPDVETKDPTTNGPQEDTDDNSPD